MVSTVRLLQPKSEAERQGESPRCEKHSQILTLFCEEDLEVLCHQCAQLPDHEGHHMRPITEAAADHRGRIQSYTQPLRRQVADLQKQLAIQERELLGLSEKVKSSRQQVSSEYESVSLLLRNTEEVVLSRLDEDEDDLQHQHNASMTDISDHISALNRLLTELAEKIVMPEVELLAAIKGTLNMYGNLKPPEPCSFRVRVPEAIIPLSYPAMQKFREDITLDPETAHPKVYLFEDKRHAIFMKRKQSVPPNPKRFEIYPAVLGSEAFNSGRHYWEVQVGSKTRWAVGVCTESLPRSVKQSQAEQNGCWTIQLHHGNYVACGTEPVTLLLKEKPRGIGVYLDCDLGEISFYNLSDRSYIHSFMYNFPEVLKPYFYVGRDSKPLGVCQVTMTDKC
ncbi:tripartite motif-containing protein 75-like [Oryctolagus cuniculus]|uniref:tripartite motif-containing protein 75-like n=1 Tax=Oryctolagus cuniculus TaxID=9986 RepID=UPI0038799AC0